MAGYCKIKMWGAFCIRIRVVGRSSVLVVRRDSCFGFILIQPAPPQDV
jgi:hypothetical protein